jgi:hypothetical protein
MTRYYITKWRGCNQHELMSKRLSYGSEAKQSDTVIFCCIFKRLFSLSLEESANWLA